ncbi:hypothetical protein AAAC51_26480, partial [Priestia megaterium]
MINKTYKGAIVNNKPANTAPKIRDKVIIFILMALTVIKSSLSTIDGKIVCIVGLKKKPSN